MAHFFPGAFLVNALLHVAQGISGNAFPTPFGSPPGEGPSSPTANVLWGSSNVVIGYLLLQVGGASQRGKTARAIAVGLGGLTIAILLSIWFGR